MFPERYPEVMQVLALYPGKKKLQSTELGQYIL